jgi:osmotically-inducible protein OsmY
MDRRVENMMKRMEQLDARKWAAEIESSDRKHSEAILNICGESDWRDPAHYHIVLDTGCLTVEQCTERVVEAARAPAFQETAATRQSLDDAILAARVRHALHGVSNGHDLRLDVRANAGWVDLAGIVDSVGSHEIVYDVIRGTPGVRGIRGEVKVAKEASTYLSE